MIVYAVSVRGLQGDPRVHRRLHLPLDEKQREQPAAQPGALPQADRGLGLINILSNSFILFLDLLGLLERLFRLDHR